MKLLTNATNFRDGVPGWDWCFRFRQRPSFVLPLWPIYFDQEEIGHFSLEAAKLPSLECFVKPEPCKKGSYQ